MNTDSDRDEATDALIEQGKKEWEEWHSSEEGIIYDLAYFGESAATEQYVVETIKRLPAQIREFALAHCVFTSVGTAFPGMVLPGRVGVDSARRRSQNVWIIVLSDDAEPDEFHGIVAHEIAHAWRHDDRLGITPEDCEVQAARLAKKWGFSGIGTLERTDLSEASE